MEHILDLKKKYGVIILKCQNHKGDNWTWYGKHIDGKSKSIWAICNQIDEINSVFKTDLKYEIIRCDIPNESIPDEIRYHLEKNDELISDEDFDKIFNPIKK